ncbi:carboxypeptidase-like regulatory domain-containing protein [Pedobacter foliorum]|uniref:carboxypeptidase-like regulatory domain-containing protein n=1 Tax=Pedobacter foliorum TaxID=2739058 RepID=UPI001563E39C|nr:carboxypeptidase-like regulatory domain-containing protein [Pedobacter foliorum]NRF37560.1 carboxypeptidase-like regulatory domain-containing protein [Pedobacter foliorum]
MSPVAGGSYCSSCQKSVIDFSNFNEKALQEWFLQHQDEKICGRFFKNQLAQQPEELKKANAWTVLSTRILAAAVLMFPFTLKASPNTSIQKQKIEAVPGTECSPKPQAIEKQTQPADSLSTINGVVWDKNIKGVVAGAEVRIKGTGIKSLTDSTGNFQISFDKGIKAVLMISHPGYQAYEQEVRAEKGKLFTIMLSQDASMLMGEVCITRKPTLLKRIIRPIQKTP